MTVVSTRRGARTRVCRVATHGDAWFRISCAFLPLAAAIPLLAQDPIRGFPPEQRKAQHHLEEKARAIPQAARLRIYMERIASKPHHAGSAGSQAVADYLAAQLKEWSLDTRIENF